MGICEGWPEISLTTLVAIANRPFVYRTPSSGLVEASNTPKVALEPRTHSPLIWSPDVACTMLFGGMVSLFA